MTDDTDIETLSADNASDAELRNILDRLNRQTERLTALERSRKTTLWSGIGVAVVGAFLWFADKTQLWNEPAIPRIIHQKLLRTDAALADALDLSSEPNSRKRVDPVLYDAIISAAAKSQSQVYTARKTFNIIITNINEKPTNLFDEETVIEDDANASGDNQPKFITFDMADPLQLFFPVVKGARIEGILNSSMANGASAHSLISGSIGQGNSLKLKAPAGGSTKQRFCQVVSHGEGADSVTIALTEEAREKVLDENEIMTASVVVTVTPPLPGAAFKCPGGP